MLRKNKTKYQTKQTSSRYYISLVLAEKENELCAESLAPQIDDSGNLTYCTLEVIFIRF